MHLNSFGFSYSNLGDTMHSVNTTARTPSKHYYKKNIKISSHKQAQIQQNILLYVSALSPIFFPTRFKGFFFSRGWSRVWIPPHVGRKKDINFLQCTNLISGDVFTSIQVFIIHSTGEKRITDNLCIDDFFPQKSTFFAYLTTAADNRQNPPQYIYYHFSVIA